MNPYDRLTAALQAADFILMATRPSVTRYKPNSKAPACLGAGARPGEPFKDASGKLYVRDMKGTIRRCSLNQPGADAALNHIKKRN